MTITLFKRAPLGTISPKRLILGRYKKTTGTDPLENMTPKQCGSNGDGSYCRKISLDGSGGQVP